MKMIYQQNCGIIELIVKNAQLPIQIIKDIPHKTRDSICILDLQA
jgi:hypothetical protein